PCAGRQREQGRGRWKRHAITNAGPVKSSCAPAVGNGKCSAVSFGDQHGVALVAHSPARTMTHSNSPRLLSARRFIGGLCVAALCCVAHSDAVAAQIEAHHDFRIANGAFLLDGKPLQIISGEMHYARIPRAYWRQRLQMAKAMGLNTIATYVFWNYHEVRPGVFDFHTGNRDLAEF